MLAAWSAEELSGEAFLVSVGSAYQRNDVLLIFLTKHFCKLYFISTSPFTIVSYKGWPLLHETLVAPFISYG